LMVPLAHNETTTCWPSGWRFVFTFVADSDVGTSPSVTSTHAGIFMPCTAPTTQMTAVNHNAPGEPNNWRNRAARPPKTAPAARPNTVNRAFVLDNVISGGSTLGVTAALSTVNDLDSTIFPSAAGYSSHVLNCTAISTHINA